MAAGPRTTSTTRWRTTWLLFVLFGLIASACTATTGDTTATSTAADVTGTTLDPALTEPLPVDPDVRTGTLDNGLQYFIRFNDAPGGRAELRLTVAAGSLHEDDDQSGVAHFLEHMMFNGTERFPRNELTAALESFGPQFGPDINASTSFDETIYEISLPNDDDLLDLGIEVLREWATEATITETDVTEERGVVLEEWRLRDQGIDGRFGQAFEDLLLPGTPYEDRAPIGAVGSIEAMTPEQLGRFYRDWYQPERMAVIAVGDFNIQEMEDRIVAGFGDITAAESPRPTPDAGAPPDNGISAISLADPELALAAINVIWPLSAAPTLTVGDIQQDVTLDTALRMLSTRMNDDALRGDTALLSASAAATPFTHGFGISVLSVDARPEQMDEAMTAVAAELARVRSHGFSDQEFGRAIEELTAEVELMFEGRESTQDEEIAAEIVDHYLAGSPLMSVEQWYEIAIEIIDQLTKANVESAFAELLEASPRVLVAGPDVPEADAWTADAEVIFAAIPTMSVEPRPDTPDLETLMFRPGVAFGSDVQIDEDLGFATITYGNGATALLWPTTIAENLVSVDVTSFGGTSLVDVADLPEAQLVAEIVSRSGIGPADAATLQAFLADRVVTAFPWISETREGIVGTSATDDAEVLLQMIHLMMTEPRVDQVALNAVLDEYRALDATRTDVPDLAVSDDLTEAYYSGDPRYFVLPTAEQLADFDAARAAAIFRERFADAGDFAFVIVGDFDMDTMIDLASRYIGTLPGGGEREQYVDHQPLPPREVQLVTVEAGTDPQGAVEMYFTNEHEPTAKDRLTVQILELIVNARLRDRIREELSATYSPSAGISLQRDPDPFVESNVQVSGDPERLEEISTAILTDLTDLTANGPTDDQFATALEQLRTEMDLIHNGILVDALTTSFLYPDQPVSELVDRYTLIDEITAADVRTLARIAFAANQRIEIRLVPIGS